MKGLQNYVVCELEYRTSISSYQYIIFNCKYLRVMKFLIILVLFTIFFVVNVQNVLNWQVKRKKRRDPPLVLVDPAVTKVTQDDATTVINLNTWQQTQLDKHNQYRALHHAPPLELDATISKVAQDYANSRCGQLVHSQNPLYGENLYWTSGAYTAPSATVSWYSQVGNYNFNNPGFTYGTGHFTQVVWIGSTKVGFGQCGGTVVANYYPPGNIVSPGYFANNVKAI